MTLQNSYGTSVDLAIREECKDLLVERELMRRELAYLRGIEAAVMVFSYDKLAASATWWALMAMPEASNNSFAREVFESVAKALEAKP